MSRRDLYDIAVVGAGVVGAAAALAFARDGLRVALVEARTPSPWRVDAPDLRVYAFAPDNAALLDGLGVWAGVRAARLQPYRAMRVWDAAGGDPLVFEADAFACRELGWIVEHGLLVDRLWSALPAAGVDLHCPDRVVALDQTDDASASLQLESGLRLHARLVLAADGGDSQLRAMAGIDTTTRDHGQSGLVAFIDHEQPHRETCWQRFLPTGPLAFLPFREGDAVGVDAADEGARRSSIVWTLPEAEALRLRDCDEAAFLCELDRAFDGPLGPMRAVSRRVAFPLKRQLAETVVAGRVALVGDAAHVVHPLAGQGVNLGLRDVAALRATVAEASKRGADIASPSRLARWARTRRSENEVAAHAFDGLNRLFSNDAMLPTLLRGPLMGLVGKVPPLTHAFWKRAAGL